ncbi:hypothetical protein LPU83_pLPU83b_0149 (plasmid) [Rhizobium favelukesii]|uniref:Uncharacterized protein n=1 Tax=Rhizobium favelukesii TaxID=348824 RepID=W6RIG2_9HYPH|nr:hypothetical protein LPU83_pLPU83b_0149 [Rhizobium favelukesii]
MISIMVNYILGNLHLGLRIVAAGSGQLSLDFQRFAPIK